MAHDTFLLQPLRGSRPASARVIEAAFVALLLFSLVGFAPFAVRNAQHLAQGAYVADGAGDLVRQLCYLATFATILCVSLWERGLAAISAVPPSIGLLLLWCVASALWAPYPDITVRRAGLEIVVVLSTILSVGLIGPDRALSLLRYVLAAILIVNWISLAIVPQAVHLPGELDVKLVGAWRGLYFQKNIAGAVTALSVIVFFYHWLKERRRIDLLLVAAAIGFLVGTQSKSSMGLLPLGLLLSLFYRAAWRRDLDRLIVAVFLIAAAILISTAAVLNWDQIARILEDPAEFTGRAAIWHAELAYIADHPLLGSGFGSFADTGGRSPLHAYIDSGWVEGVAHGHSGYLQLIVTIGLIGFCLAIWSLILVPVWAFWRRSALTIELKALLFGMFVFVVLHNVLESDFLEGDGPAWMFFLIMLGLLRCASDVETLAGEPA